MTADRAVGSLGLWVGRIGGGCAPTSRAVGSPLGCGSVGLVVGVHRRGPAALRDVVTVVVVVCPCRVREGTGVFEEFHQTHLVFEEFHKNPLQDFSFGCVEVETYFV